MLEVKDGDVFYELDCPSFEELKRAYAFFKKERERHRAKSKRRYTQKKVRTTQEDNIVDK
jgi:hypothetical protein